MTTLVFDIETVGEDFDKLDSTTQDLLTRWARKEYIGNNTGYDIALDDLKNSLGLSPLTGEIVSIGMIEHRGGAGAVYYQADGGKDNDFEREGIVFKQMSEKEMLVSFWKIVSQCDRFVTFNGRRFDIPFLILRSAIHGVRPSKDLMTHRYLESQSEYVRHIDLQDQLSFYGASRHRGSNSLHMYCRAFGIKSPSSKGVTGAGIAKLFHKKCFFDIATHNVQSVQAIKILYDKWFNLIHKK